LADWPWVIWSYALTWVVLGTYALLVNRWLTRARAELNEELEREHPSPEVEE
jgi:hypothetical protein